MRRRRNDSIMQPCRCRECLAQNPEGSLVSYTVLNTHRHRERLRGAFPSSVRGETAETEKPDTLGVEPAGDTPSESQTSSKGKGKAGFDVETKIDQDINFSPQAIIHEIDVRMETLYHSEDRLTFINEPSPHLPFVFPNPETLPQVNSGHFALDTTKLPNRRLLDAEARFCGLLKTIQTMPSGERSTGETDVEDELFLALNKIHRIKERQWRSQAYPDGRGGSTFDNSMYSLPLP
ncbi:hypothetical protein C8J55DRAFT_492091 [Lentinula edodes]|uniref:Uncharacterized protein n=1 Tax=Lentinula lateritia TaxID=40482 RepID=A0A9W9DH85_9AGAR|nr:hypothetical protein C8J55DRAFT_492091 [Lentinula edodes]